MRNAKMKKFLASILFLASTAHADPQYLCNQCALVATPTTTATVTPTATATITATATPAPSLAPIVFKPAYFDGLLANPGIGLQTTQRPIAASANPRGIPTTDQVFRFWMHSVNSAPGVFNWSELDNAITKARAAGQTLNVGFYAFDPYGGAWMKGYATGTLTRCTEEGNGTYWAPNFDDPVVLSAHRGFVSAFAARYNNNPTIGFVDVRSMGSYGEHHHYCQVVAATGAPLPIPSAASRKQILKDYRDLITKPLVIIQDDFDPGPSVLRAEAKAAGIGYRRDCWGGHHENNQYPKWNTNPVDMRDMWKVAPFLVEPCGQMTNTDLFSVKQKVDQVLAAHGSLVNSKNQFAFTNEQWPEWKRMLTFLGYRFTIEEAQATRTPGHVSLLVKWRNEGVAPVYADTYLAVRIGDITRTFPVRGRLPGALTDTAEFDLAPGNYAASVALLQGGVPAIRFANGTGALGWLRLGDLTVP